MQHPHLELLDVWKEALWLELLPAPWGVRERGEEGPFKTVTELGHTNSCF